MPLPLVASVVNARVSCSGTVYLGATGSGATGSGAMCSRVTGSGKAASAGIDSKGL